MWPPAALLQDEETAAILTPQNNSDDNPWGNRPSQGKPTESRNPWDNAAGEEKARDNSQRKGGRTPPPLPPIFKNFRFNGPDGVTPAMIGLGFGVVVLLWLASGLYRVQPEENAVVTRFGKYTETVIDPGLHYHLPWPVEKVLKPNVMFERRIELGYQGAYGGTSKRDIPEESMMLTGDANIVDLDFVVQWKISDAKQYLFNIRDVEGTLKRVAESAMREVIGQNQLQDIITDKREDISIRVKEIMQQILNSYKSGVMVTQVLVQDASVPAPVLDAFEDVIKATQQSETMRNQGLRYRNEIIPRAQGEAIRLIKEAEGYKLQIVSQAQGDAQRFTNIYDAYSQAKDVTRDRLYIEAWEHILTHNHPTILEGSEGVSPLPYLNLNALRKPDNQPTSIITSRGEVQ